MDTKIIDTEQAPRFEVEVYHDGDPYVPEIGDKFVVVDVKEVEDKNRLCDVSVARLEPVKTMDKIIELAKDVVVLIYIALGGVIGISLILVLVAGLAGK